MRKWKTEEKEERGDKKPTERDPGGSFLLHFLPLIWECSSCKYNIFIMIRQVHWDWDGGWWSGMAAVPLARTPVLFYGNSFWGEKGHGFWVPAEDLEHRFWDRFKCSRSALSATWHLEIFLPYCRIFLSETHDLWAGWAFSLIIEGKRTNRLIYSHLPVHFEVIKTVCTSIKDQNDHFIIML